MNALVSTISFAVGPEREDGPSMEGRVRVTKVAPIDRDVPLIACCGMTSRRRQAADAAG